MSRVAYIRLVTPPGLLLANHVYWVLSPPPNGLYISPAEYWSHCPLSAFLPRTTVITRTTPYCCSCFLTGEGNWESRERGNVAILCADRNTEKYKTGLKYSNWDPTVSQKKISNRGVVLRTIFSLERSAEFRVFCVYSGKSDEKLQMFTKWAATITRPIDEIVCVLSN